MKPTRSGDPANRSISAQQVNDYFVDTMYFDDTDLSPAEVLQIKEAALRGLYRAPAETGPGLQVAIDTVSTEIAGLGVALEDGSERAMVQASVRYTLRRLRRLLRAQLRSSVSAPAQPPPGHK